MISLFSQNKNSDFCAPLTSFDWNEVDPNLLGTSSIDTTCTIWGLEVFIIQHGFGIMIEFISIYLFSPNNHNQSKFVLYTTHFYLQGCRVSITFNSSISLYIRTTYMYILMAHDLFISLV